MKKYIVIIALLLTGIAPATSHAGDGMKSQQAFHQELQLTRAMLEAERKSLIAQSLQISEKAAAFWKVYNDYRARMIKVNDRRGKVITDYADALLNNNLSDKDVTKLLNRSLNVFQDQIKVKKSFVFKFKKVLTPKQMARFYQIDHRIDLLVNAAIAELVPLVEDGDHKEAL